jgi:sugar lactone lactonase YvrE
VICGLVLAGAGLAATATRDNNQVGTAGAQGLVETLAGPGYCPRAARRQGTSQHTGAVAVSAAGRVFYETGPSEEPVLAVVGTEGHVETWGHRIGQPPTLSGAPPAVADTATGAGRLAVDPAPKETADESGTATDSQQQETGQGLDGGEPPAELDDLGDLPGEGDGVVVAAGTRIVRLAGDGERTTIAGPATGKLGGVGVERGGDSGPVEQAAFRSATSLTRDTEGNLYVADHGGPALATATVRFINRSDQPVTFYPDTRQEITVASGHIDTIAGQPPPSENADGEAAAKGGSARSTVFHGNTTLAVRGNRLYVGGALDPGGTGEPKWAVRLVNLGGAAIEAHGRTVEPGNAAVVAGGDHATALSSVAGIAVDDGDLFIADPVQHRIHQLDAEGFLATYAGVEGLGSEVGGFNDNHQVAVGARLNQPMDVAVGPDGDVYVSDRRNGQVRVIDRRTQRIRPVRGSSIALAWTCHDLDTATTDQPPRRGAGGPTAVVADQAGHAYFALADGHQIKRRNTSGTITTVAGQPDSSCPLSCPGFAGGHIPAGDANLDTPTGLTLDPDGILYVYDGGNARVRAINLNDEPITVHKVTIDAGHIATVAGTGTPGHNGDGGPATEATLGEVDFVHDLGLVEQGERAARGVGYAYVLQRNFGDLAIDSQGNLFIAEPPQYPDDYRSRRDEPPDVEAPVRKVDPQGQITTVAGAGATGAAGNCCTNPAGLTIDGNDNLYIADLATHQIWLHNPNSTPAEVYGQTIPAGDTAPIAGTRTQGFAGDGGPASQAQLLAPTGLALDASGALHFTEFDPQGSYLRRITPDGTIDLLAGNGQPGFDGDGRDPRLTSLNLTSDVAVDPCGNLLVADAGNDRLRRINLTDACSPSTSSPDSSSNTPEFPALLLFGSLGLAGVGGVIGGWYWRRDR